MWFLRAAALAALWVTFALTPAIAAETAWTKDPAFADSAQQVAGPLSLYSPERATTRQTYYWGPRAGSDASPLVVISPGARVSIVWDADTTGTGTVTLSIQKASGTGSGSNEWEERDVIPAATSCADPATTCSQKFIPDPGAYRFVPSGTAANGRLRLDAY